MQFSPLWGPRIAIRLCGEKEEGTYGYAVFGRSRRLAPETEWSKFLLT